MLNGAPASQASGLPNLLRLLADKTRLRALSLLAREELAVGELARILGLSLSRLSNHLRILREAGMIADRKEGSWTFVSLNRAGGLPAGLWDAVQGLVEQSPEYLDDAARLREVLEARRQKSRAFFDRVAKDWDVIGSDFRTGVGRHRVAASLVAPDLVVADIGCGTGYLASALAPLVARVILIDHSPAMLERARENLAGSRAVLEFRSGEIDRLPLEDGEADAVLAGMVVHHAPDLLAFGREAFRVLRRGGILVVEDLLPHREAWMREAMADLRLGLVPDDLASLVRDVGFDAPVIELLDDAYTPSGPDGAKPELPLFLLRARKPRNGAF